MKTLYALILSLLIPCTVSAQTIIVPDPIPDVTPVELSHAQKSVKTSTDIVTIALPAATLAGVLIMQDWEGLKEGAFTAVASLGATYLLKWTVNERRPDRTSFDSFPSGHTSACFATATFLQKRYGWKFGVPAYVASTYVAWGRCFSKRHHWWDVVAGAAIGTASAWIFTTPFAKKHELTITPWTDGRHLAVSTSFTF